MISVETATGGQVKVLFSNANYAITQVRAVTSTILLFTIYNAPFNGSTSDTSHNGLWKINTDGTGLTRLTKGNEGLVNETQFPWSNVSRNNSLYAVQDFTKQPQALLIGSLKGGAPTTLSPLMYR